MPAINWTGIRFTGVPLEIQPGDHTEAEYLDETERFNLIVIRDWPDWSEIPETLYVLRDSYPIPEAQFAKYDDMVAEVSSRLSGA